MRICNCCWKLMSVSSYHAQASKRLSDGIGINVQLHIDGLADVCPACVDNAAYEAVHRAFEILGTLEEAAEHER